MTASIATKPAEDLSKGEHAAEAVRPIGVWRAPEAVLLDEPTSALDEASARAIEELLLSIVYERRMTCVIVTHNRSQAARLSARTMVLKSGMLVAIGPTQEMLNDY